MINTPTAGETGSIRKEFIQHDLIHSPAKEQLGEGRAWTPNIIATTIVVAVPAYITGTCIHVRTVGFTEHSGRTLPELRRQRDIVRPHFSFNNTF